MYNTDEAYPPPLPPAVQAVAEERGVARERYLVLKYEDRFNDGLETLMQMAAAGELVCLETYPEETGLAEAPAAFVSMMSGGNMGKQLVQCVADRDLPAGLRRANWAREHLPAAAKRKLAGFIKL
jgi:NADPH-dependent curcumin reductase CurA